MQTKYNTTSDSETHCIECVDAMYRYALFLTCNPEDAEGLVQETYARALQLIGNPWGGGNAKKGLFAILRDIWLHDVGRSHPKSDESPVRRRGPHSAVGYPGGLHHASASGIEDEQVRIAVRSLPVPYCEVILLREFEDLSYHSIATVLGCPVGTVVARLSQARTALRELLAA
ncbi:sigma factor-like helix-turn-helix DNA-binding protein [Granulicella mallensis]|uniref:RNA polymerase, sigma-24 subunit, ECF subfamily n=2 Tax=Granulicella mallensis TaxID=940614 RepID=G8P0F8_GRAMM|nr:sigma factor-like helix-turn-helix DNA-binding protein [Granulicella mallensis]AEU38046.1 RNA polymerase, sigma-24 subunit, ECF subfamily [Granulicella mallensis MP5ACTX8]MBB5066748.1 RNA polymerase sigma-70 factor (ECF subfamily) [Granulicella mallensis]